MSFEDTSGWMELLKVCLKVFQFKSLWMSLWEKFIRWNEAMEEEGIRHKADNTIFYYKLLQWMQIVRHLTDMT